MANTAANAALSYTVGINTGIGGPHTKRVHGPREIFLASDGLAWAYVFNNTGGTLSAGAVGMTVAAVDGTLTNTIVAGSGWTIDKDVADQSWYYARSAEGGIGPLADAIPTIAFAAGAANVCTITITWKDAVGNTIAGIRNFRLMLSDASSGAGLTSTAASGEVVATTGVNIMTVVTHKAWDVATAATGIFVGSLTDTEKTAGYYITVVDLQTGRVYPAATATVTGSYGA